MLCSLHHHLVPEHGHHPRKSTCTNGPSLPSAPASQPWQPLICFVSVGLLTLDISYKWDHSSILLVIRRMKIKATREAMRPLEWTNLKRPTIPDAWGATRNPHTVGRNAKWYSKFGRQFRSFYTIQLKTFTPGYIPKRKKNICIFTHKSLQANVYSSFIYNNLKLETTPCP